MRWVLLVVALLLVLLGASVLARQLTSVDPLPPPSEAETLAPSRSPPPPVPPLPLPRAPSPPPDGAIETRWSAFEGDTDDEAGPPFDAGPLTATTRAGLEAALQARAADVDGCLASWGARSPGLRRYLPVAIRVGESRGLGFVDKVEVVDGGLDSVAFTKCLARSLSAVRFEAPKSGWARFRVTLVYSRDGGA